MPASRLPAAHTLVVPAPILDIRDLRNPFPPNLGGVVLVAHPDLYEALPDGTGTLKIRGGRVELGSVLRAPFGQLLAPGQLLELAGIRDGLPSTLMPCD